MKRISRRDSKQDMGQTAHVSKVVGGCSLSVNWLVACLAGGQDVAPNHVTAYSGCKGRFVAMRHQGLQDHL